MDKIFKPKKTDTAPRSPNVNVPLRALNKGETMDVGGFLICPPILTLEENKNGVWEDWTSSGFERFVHLRYLRLPEECAAWEHWETGLPKLQHLIKELNGNGPFLAW